MKDPREVTENGILISLSLNNKIIFEDVFSLKEKNVAILRSNDIAIARYNKISFNHVEEV